jgi:hypothetical protein
MYVCMYVCMAGEIVSLAGCAAGVAETVCSVDRFDSSTYTYLHKLHTYITYKFYSTEMIQSKQYRFLLL